MLVLSRLVSQEIVIGDDIRVTVVDVQNGKCRLGIDAPRNIGVHRREVYDAIKRGESKPPKTSREAQREWEQD